MAWDVVSGAQPVSLDVYMPGLMNSLTVSLHVDHGNPVERKAGEYMPDWG